jgi:hypothetical protein
VELEGSAIPSSSNLWPVTAIRSPRSGRGYARRSRQFRRVPTAPAARYNPAAQLLLRAMEIRMNTVEAAAGETFDVAYLMVSGTTTAARAPELLHGLIELGFTTVIAVPTPNASRVIGSRFRQCRRREIPFSLEISKASFHTFCKIYANGLRHTLHGRPVRGNLGELGGQ